MKTSELTGAALAWAVAKAEGLKITVFTNPQQVMVGDIRGDGIHDFNPGDNWSQGGPIIAREGLYLKARNDAKEWKAGALSMNRADNKPGPLYNGHTPLIAAMRCHVASKLGDEVNVPEELK